MDPSHCRNSLILHVNWNFLLHFNRTINSSSFSCQGLSGGSQSISAIGPLILLLWSILGAGMRRMGRKPEGDGSRPQGSQGEGRPPTDRRPVDRRPPRRFERPAGEGGEKPEGGEFSVEKWVWFPMSRYFSWKEEGSESNALLLFTGCVQAPNTAKVALIRGVGVGSATVEALLMIRHSMSCPTAAMQLFISSAYLKLI